MAYDFSGTNQYLDLASAPVTAVPLTLVGWYRYDTAIADEAEHTVLSLTDADAQQEFTIEIGRTGGTDYAIAMINAGGTLGFAVSSTPPTINTWQHLGGVYSTTSRRDVYLNGVNVGNDTTSATPSGISNVNIGATLSSGTPIKDFNGALAECAIWNVALTDAEMAMLADAFPPNQIRPNNLVFYSPLVRGLQNWIGGTNLTNNSGTVFAHPRMFHSSSTIYSQIDSVSDIKTFNNLANASTKTVIGIANASIKTWNGISN